MALVIIGILIVFLIVLGLVGYSRDMRRGIMSLAGTLLGATLVDFWAEPLAGDLAERLGAQPQSLLLFSSVLIFLLTVFLVGYGGGSLLGRSKERTSLGRRAAGALLGMLNAVLIVAYTLRYASVSNPLLQATIQTSPITQALHDGLPLLFLLFAMVVGSIVVVRSCVILLQRAVAVPRQQAQQQAKQAQQQAKQAEEARRKKELEERQAKLQQQWLQEQLQTTTKQAQEQQAAQQQAAAKQEQAAAKQQQPAGKQQQRENSRRILDRLNIKFPGNKEG